LLQEKRKEKAAVESHYLQGMQRYNNAVSEHQTAAMDLDDESKKLRAEIALSQSKFFNIQGILGGQMGQQKRISDEQCANEAGNPVSKRLKTYAKYFQKKIAEMKKQMAELKERKKSIGGQSAENQKQLEGFQSLRRLLHRVSGKSSKTERMQPRAKRVEARGEALSAERHL
jgi:phage shock protein A